MRITTLQVKNFKNLPDDVYTFGDTNIIRGQNGSGKSSIAEAVVFALYGRTKTGSSSSSDLINNDQETCVVAIEFDTGTTLVREESRFYGSKVQLNGTVIDQKDLDEHIPNHKIFMSTFLIGYFFSIDESDQRELILSLTEEIDLKELFLEVTRKPELLENHLINFKQIDKELKLFKTKLKDLQNLKNNGQVEIDVLTQQMKNTKRPAKKFDIEELEKELEANSLFDQYDKAIAHNEAIEERINHINAGKCDTCHQEVSKEKRAEIQKELEAQMVKVPPKPKGKKKDQYELQEKLSQAKSNNLLFDEFEEQILDMQKQVTDKEDQLRKADEVIPELEEIVNALSPKGIKAMEMRKKLDPIIKVLNTDDAYKIKIETLEKLKTKDSYREVFTVSLNEVPYKFLSTGERKLVDIKFSQLINSFQDDPIDMFYLDDAELLSHPDNLSGQVFKAYVTSDKLNIADK